MGDLTWVEMRNHVIEDWSTQSLIMKNMIFDMKQFLIGAPGYETNGTAGVWSVISSCDGAGTRADSDLWLTAANIIRNTGTNTHSWIRLRNATLGLELVMDVNNDNDQWPMTFFFSPAFTLTPGTATVRPTSLIEWSHWMSSTSDYMLRNTVGPCKLHGLLATRGDFWLCFSYDGTNGIRWALGACNLFDTKPGDLYPQVTSYTGSYDNGAGNGFSRRQWYPTGSGNGGEVWSAACVKGRSYTGQVAGSIFNGSLVMGGVVPTIGWHSGYADYNISPSYGPGISPLDYNTQPDPADGFYPTFPVIIGCAGWNYHGFKGRWPDLLMGGVGPANNTSYPNVGAQTLLKLNYTWVPFTQRLAL